MGDTDGLSQEEKETLAFSMLPLVCRGWTARVWGKCSFQESELFYDFQPEGTDLAFYIGQIDRKQRPQPFILLMGGSWKKPLQTFVIRKFSLHDAKTENTRKRSLVTVPVL
ncbi:uncharacterized protein [Diadema antillarum]|uniref:uncharacterized protein n=1 Tax=Diadema antillarum TaxID=105358 RepID=UPI003A84DC99